MPDAAATSYDQTPYPSLSYTQTHPDRLAALARLLGLEPAPVEACRVLELGCAGGGNLLPMAYTLPGSHFVGLDASVRQIADGQAAVAALGLKNVTLQAMDILEMSPALGADFGRFDYIIAHGLYSWAPRPVRDRLLAICRQRLAPNGVAYISYNVYPGWHMLGMVREMMHYHTRHVADPQRRAAEARALVTFLTEAVPADNAFGSFLETYHNMLRKKVAEGQTSGDALLLHDELEEINEPVYFYQFVEHAAAHGLQYLVEAQFADVMPGRFPPPVVAGLRRLAKNTVELEQYMDFLKNRTFRQTLLCHREVHVDRAIRPERLANFLLATRARPAPAESDKPEVARFRALDGAVFSTDHPLTRAAFLHLVRRSPQAVHFVELARTAAADCFPDPGAADLAREQHILAANLLQAYGYSGGLIELHVYAPPLVLVSGERPVASALARWQAANGLRVTNLRHERVSLDETARRLLLRLDGQHDRAALQAWWAREVAAGAGTQPSPEALAQDLARNLAWLARAALLEA
ncbi:MAG: class I SAM-dependent methyltransferase [Chloroflexi bacterium]|nr:class I SAM-dependent methyltransferase [Chloroflexota bacterium]MCI0575596.1 class I SAM-dependent methyltransferase [Chloroflexota bacterium]MCI0645067.1 class I SAM-dependent methyltransferase [Chloroflexota bacterium]MCI0731903.1 class I SAM-dependent methyltransferase [Chloroflexota bacterium]